MNKFDISADFGKFQEVFLHQNSILNLISKNEEKYLFEKHIYDSLSIKLFFNKYKIENFELLDIGTGGGFPAIPIAIEYSSDKVTALDSIRKKIEAVNAIKEELGLHNLTVLCERAENLKNKKFSIITSRAVAPLNVLLRYANNLLKHNGYFIAYKSKKSDEELEEAKSVLYHTNLKYIDCIEYVLPLNEVYERKLMIFKKY